MHIDYKHRIVSGPAGVGVHVGQYTMDGQVSMALIQPPTAGNGACWWANGVLFNAAEGRLSSCWPDGTGTGPVSPNAATSFGAIGLEWAAFLADGHTGVYTSWGLSLPDSRLTGTGPALYTVPQSGHGLSCYLQGGFAPAWELPTAAPLDFYAVNNSAILWTEGDRRIRTEGLPPITQIEPIYSPSAFFCAGRWWLLHARGTGGAIVRPFDDPTHGFIVADGNAFGLAFSVPIDSFRTLFAWSTDAGETVVWARTIDLSAPLQDLTPPVVIPPIAPFTHPVQVAAFKDPTGATGHPAIETFGIIVETLPPPPPLPTVRRIWIRDNDTLPYVPEGWRQGEWALVELYRRKTETLSQSVVRWSTDLARTLRLWPYDVGVIPQLYCQGGAPPDELWTVQEVLDGLAYLSPLVNLDVRIKVIAPFCYLRPNGMIAHPELLAAFYQMVAASPGTPTFVPLSGTHHPSVVLLT